MSFWLFLFRDDNEGKGEGEGEGGFRGLFYKGPDSKQRTPAAWLVTPDFRITSKAATIPSPNPYLPSPSPNTIPTTLTLQLNLLPQAIPITFLPPHRHTPSPHHHRHHSPTPSLAQVSDTASFDVGAQTNGPSLTRMLASGARRCEHGSMA